MCLVYVCLLDYDLIKFRQKLFMSNYDGFKSILKYFYLYYLL